MKYRVWFIRNSASGTRTFEVPDWAAGRWFLDGMMRLEPRANWAESEACGLEIFTNEEWIEWQDETDRSVLEYIKYYKSHVREDDT